MLRAFLDLLLFGLFCFNPRLDFAFQCIGNNITCHITTPHAIHAFLLDLNEVAFLIKAVGKQSARIISGILRIRESQPNFPITDQPIACREVYGIVL